MRNNDEDDKRLGTVQSVDRAVTILELLAHQGSLGVTDLARELAVHKSTASRLVGALEQRGLVEQVEQRGKYRLGPGVLRLAGATTARLDLVHEARPICKRLAAETGETVNIAVLATNTALYIDQVSDSLGAANWDWVGQHIPLHATSNGKVLLSELTPADVRGLVRDLTPYTANTLTSRAALTEELERVRANGYALARDELDSGLTAVAAPIRNAHGEIVASLSASGPTFRMGPKVEDAIPLVMAAAREISLRLGGPATTRVDGSPGH